MEGTHPLRAWRLRQRPPVNQQKLAERIGAKSKAFISRIENWEREPSLTTAAKLSEETGIPIDSFVKQDEAAQ
jgi:transcriptional regulator with XRE-family HTH domain